jgi:hypothetical protein
MPLVYRPIARALSGPESLRDAIQWYAAIGAAPYWRWQNIYRDEWEIHSPEDWKWERLEPDGLGKWLYGPKASSIFSATGSNE